MFEVKIVKHIERKVELLDLFRISFGKTISDKLWSWKYLQNPLAPTDPEIIVAIKDETIIGARPFILNEVWIKNEKVKTANPIDTMVHPKHWRKGVFAQMNQRSIEYLKGRGFELFFNFPGPKTFPGYLKQGWKIVASQEWLFKPLNYNRLITHKLKCKVFTKRNTIFRRSSNRRKIGSPTYLKVEIFNQFDDKLKEVDDLRDKTKIDLVRNEAFLRWRFHQHPEHLYRYISIGEYNHILGYAVISTQIQSNGIIFGLIIDYLVKNKDVNIFKLLINKCIFELEKTNCDILFIWAYNEKFREIILDFFRFKSPLTFPYNKFFSKSYFVVLGFNEKKEKVNVYSKKNWEITYAYTDTK